MKPQSNQEPESPCRRVWTAEEFAREFELLGLLVSPAIVRRKVDGMKGTIRFEGCPRVFFDFQPERHHG